ncbi:MAG: rhomboid family intramembrane serine protease [Sphingomonadales bacterium]|nr:rhomboid family intramembrane serine protease [Sphingomonadales bacterium]
MFQNLPQVTKNILLLNIAFFVASLLLKNQGIDLVQSLGAHYINSPFFQPFQVVTHFFMHSTENFLHIFFNMWLFAMLGAFLENIWGAKRFFIFYFVSAMGSFALYNMIGFIEIMNLKAQLASQIDLDQFNYFLTHRIDYNGDTLNQINAYLNETEIKPGPHFQEQISTYIGKSFTPMVGASGGVFGIMTAFALLFPNTEFRLYFAIPIKAKYFVAGYFLLELYLAFQNQVGDNVAHLAHVGGAFAGAIMVMIWRKNDRSNFW